MNKKYSVTGMTCAACSSGIERTVSKLDGVSSCSVSLMGESMDVTFDESKLSDGDIRAAVTSLGYGAYDYGKAPAKKQKGLTLKLRFFLSLVLLLPEMYLAMGHMIGLPVPSGWLNYGFQIGLTLAVLCINYRFFASGVMAAVKLVPNMDTLVTLGAAASFLYSLAVAVSGSGGHLFFESAAMIVTLVTLGKWLEDRSKARTGKEVEKLLSLAPDTVTLLKDGKEVRVPLAEVKAGDLVVVKQGGSVAVDGTIIEGHAFVDQAAITGESLPVELAEGGRAVSASIVTSGYLLIRAEQVGEDTLLSGVIRMVREAGASKAPIQKLADKVAAVFVPVVVTLALITFAVWLIVTHDLAQAVNFGVSVLVISCPCALGLATPVAIMAATGRGASMGVLYKNAEALQRAADIKTVLLDKTATLTEGKPKVVSFEGEEGAKRIAYALEIKLDHPLSRCIAEFCGEGEHAEEVEYLTGLGAHGFVNGKEYFLGNDRLMKEKGLPFGAWQERFDALSEAGSTVLFLADRERILALFALADTLKEGSREAVKELQAMGCNVRMLTGDNKKVAAHIAGEAGIAKEDVYAEVLPEDKLRAVQACRKENAKLSGRTKKGVAMVGDGINDSPALKAADVGFAMGGGTDIAIESADVVLVGSDLRAAQKAVALSRRTMRIVKENLFWAFFYNCIGIPLAAGVFAFAGVTLNPMIASAAMSLSSLFVVTNALRLVRFQRKKTGRAPEQGEQVMTKKFKVEGMMCMHCVAHVKAALEGVAGVGKAEVDLKKKTALVTLNEDVPSETLIAAVTEAGYSAKEI